jgi:hypothetical protein
VPHSVVRLLVRAHADRRRLDGNAPLVWDGQVCELPQLDEDV